jgi:hypothetical protein
MMRNEQHGVSLSGDNGYIRNPYSKAHKNTGCFKEALQLLKLIQIYSENMHSALNCYNVPKYTDQMKGVLYPSMQRHYRST